nr:integrase, catalytic region, zinc finger, CCHC-type, peptidase aspartic, catalytic [Tanacetum cinerariifolium]
NPHQALKDNVIIDSGYSRHMTGNISYLSNFEEINEGYVAFGGNPKGGKITGKDNLKKLKGKVVVDEAVISHPIDPEMLKVDVAPLAPKLQNNRTSHSDYLKHTQKETTSLKEIVEHERSLNPLNTSLDYACCPNCSLLFGLRLLQAHDQRSLSDNGTEFVNQTLRKYYDQVGISHETYVARSPQQNGVVERRNRMLIEAARTIVDHPAPKIIAPITEVVAPEPVESTGSPSSTTVDQDAPPAIFTRLQLHEQALFCNYDAFLTSVEPKTYKDALTQSSWIEAMKEELNEFERLEV